MSTTKDSKPHTIVIERTDDDAMEIDWHIEHNDTCELKKEFLDFDGNPIDPPYEYYNCGVQCDIDYGGLWSLAYMLGLEREYKIPVGSYKVRGCYGYDEYTREGDYWLEPWEE